MERFMNFIQEKLVPPLVKLGNQRHLMAVRNGLAITIPFIIIGSLFLIIGNLPFEWWGKFIGDFGPKLNAPVNVTFGALSLIASAGIGYSLAKEYKLDPISGGIIALIGFLLTQVNEKYELMIDNFGSTGLFTAIIVSLIAIEILKLFVKKNIVIKLPDGVPPAIANSFVALLPGGAVLLVVWLIRVVIGFDITEFLALVFSPLVFALNTLPGMLILVLFICLLWSVGVHGDAVLGSIAGPIFLQYLTANTEAYMNNQPIPYITAEGFNTMFVCMGGTGVTMALVLLCLRSKSKVYKSFGKLAFPSSVFEISEPVVFGFPIVFNPLMFIPFIVTPLVLTTITYFLMYFDIIGRPVAMVPWTMPPIIGPFLLTGGDWKAAVWSVLALIIAVVIYYPFFKAAEKQQLKLEKNEELSAGKSEVSM
ncbi:PTS sugar transporter subunit IIC [Neobacillus niacini]|uniref:PTS sugar transporter subunit IIC n=1 Tax=Neobacillus niacini TaxID=86668 RepID=UPI0021CB339E|nr:PTS sugar transporter subunit IIC [Neobacillus niacini]MCM3763892.1 PTS sugar transporter subunit IIC [Neobacillus niacini]